MSKLNLEKKNGNTLIHHISVKKAFDGTPLLEEGVERVDLVVLRLFFHVPRSSGDTEHGCECAHSTQP